MNELKEYGFDPIIADPVADVEEAKRIYGINFSSMDEVIDRSLAVAHDEFKKLEKIDLDRLLGAGQKVLLDVKGILNPKEYTDYSFWRL